MKSVFKFSLLNAWRSRHIQVFSFVLILSIAISSVSVVLGIKAREKQFEMARQEVRNAWLGQGATNPHNAAHYGHYVFLPVYGIQALDPGIISYTGNVIRLEAHVQHEPSFSPAQLRTETSRLGNFGLNWIYQSLFPLFIILLCFSSVSADREQQVLRMISAQGRLNHDYLWGKVWAAFFVVACISLAGLAIHSLMTVVWGGQAFGVQDALHALAWTGVHLLYYLVIILLSVIVSAWASSSRASLFIQLSIWALFLVVIPKLTTSLGASLYPLEQRSAFNTSLREDREKGIDGHNPEDKRYKAFEDSLLRHYGVDSISRLPINADGLIMQADEEYANLVYDRHFTRIGETIRKQQSVARYASLLNPYLAVRHLSMGITQSDFPHQMSFFRGAEDYRRYLIHDLNTKMAYGGSKTGDWDWTADPGYWASVRDFQYPRPSLAWSVKPYRLEALVLLVWLFVASSMLAWTGRHLKII